LSERTAVDVGVAPDRAAGTRKLGCKIPNAGRDPGRLGLAAMAVAAEEAGADSLWAADHVVMLTHLSSRYPYAEGGIHRRAEEDYYHALISCTWMAAVTSRVEIGTAVYVLPQRGAVEVAKMVATLDALSGGRAVLGVGAGWCAEEFDILGYSFPDRFKRFDEQIAVLRHCWSGSGAEFEGAFHSIPEGTFCIPRPARESGVPLLIGGMAPGPLRRAATAGDGWLAVVNAELYDAEQLRAQLTEVRQLRAEAGGAPFRTTARLQVGKRTDFPAVSQELGGELFDMGFEEVIIDPGWRSIDEAQEIIAGTRAALIGTSA
jgi:probable F420-dependent oxidoreductase